MKAQKAKTVVRQHQEAAVLVEQHKVEVQEADEYGLKLHQDQARSRLRRSEAELRRLEPLMPAAKAALFELQVKVSVNKQVEMHVLEKIKSAPNELPDGYTPEEFAAKQVKLARRGGLTRDQRLVKQGRRAWQKDVECNPSRVKTATVGRSQVSS